MQPTLQPTSCWLPSMSGNTSATPFSSLYSWQRAHPDASGTGILIPTRAVKSSKRMFVIRTPAGEVGKFIADEGTAKVPLSSTRTRHQFLSPTRYLAPPRTAPQPVNTPPLQVPLNGKERTVDDYEFLILADSAVPSWETTWYPPPDGCVWASERMVVICAIDNEDRDPGKYICNEAKAVVPRHGKEETLPNSHYQFLVVRHGGAAAAGGAAADAREACRALGERGEKLDSLASATERMAGEAQSMADMASQINQQQQRRLFPW